MKLKGKGNEQNHYREGKQAKSIEAGTHVGALVDLGHGLTAACCTPILRDSTAGPGTSFVGVRSPGSLSHLRLSRDSSLPSAARASIERAAASRVMNVLEGLWS